MANDKPDAPTIADITSDAYHTERLRTRGTQHTGPDGERGDAALHLALTDELTAIAKRGELTAERWPQIVVLEPLDAATATPRAGTRTSAALPWPPTGAAYGKAVAEWEQGLPKRPENLPMSRFRIDSGGNGRTISVDIARVGRADQPAFVIDLAQHVSEVRTADVHGSPGLIIPGDMTSAAGSIMEVHGLYRQGDEWRMSDPSTDRADRHNGSVIVQVLRFVAAHPPGADPAGPQGIAYHCHGTDAVPILQRHVVRGHVRWIDERIEFQQTTRIAIRATAEETGTTAAQLINSGWTMAYATADELRWQQQRAQH